ncbi:MAG TPA: MG2 domain-containing protein, partial [Ignavibacteriaceae bacterium]|nr:MG2 domain-containing protein [Ignavibacteriaceae bacterium]
MSNRFALLLILFLGSFLFSFISFSSKLDGGKISIALNSRDDYDKAWHKVDSLQNKGLTRSALEVVEQIYDAAKKENNQPQIIKSFIHKLKFANYTEEESNKKIVNEVKREIDSSSFPAKAIFRSILAQIYWQYYTYNRYRFQNRTETVNFDYEDFQTWDLPHLIREIINQYQLSLSESDSLKKIPIDEFNEVIVYFNSKEAYLRPTLFDILAHNALDFYTNDEASVTEPVYKFEFKDEIEFAPAEEFIKINFETRDSLSLKFFAAKLFQSVLHFHLRDDKKDALIDADLMRLNYIRKQSVNPFKDSLYLNSLETMEKKYSGEPYSSLISFNKANYFYESGNKYNPEVSDAYKWDLKKAIEICDAAIEKFPESKGASECKWLKNTISRKEIDIQTENGNMPGKPFRGLINYRNVKKIYLRIIPWNERKEKYLPKDEPAVNKFYASQKPLKKWEVELPDDKDFQKHSVEIKIPDLEIGQYMLLVSSDENFSAENNFAANGKIWVTDLCYLRREKSDESEIVVMNRRTGHPVSGADVIRYVHKYTPDYREYRYERAGSGKTDQDGRIIFPKDKNSYDNYKIAIIKDDDRFESGDFYPYYYDYEYETEVKTFFFPDRGIYRPGQTVYFKGLMIKSDGKKDHQVLTDHKTTINFYDANSQKISDLNLTTNEYGTFNGSFVIPFGKIGGQYYITDGRDAQYFRVEEYKRPKFEVKFDPVKGSYSINDKVKVSGFAKSYSGVNLNNAEVKFRVVRRAEFPYFYYWWGSFYDWFNSNTNEMEITNGVTETDKEGKFNLEFNLVPDLSIPKETKPVFHYTIYADVVDITGETHSAQAYVNAGYVALLSNINLPEILDKDSLGKYYISTTNLNGEFEPAEVSITVQKLKSPDRIFRNRIWEKPDKFIYTKEEFYKFFDHDVYKDENEFYNWEKAEKVFGSQFTTTDPSRQSQDGTGSSFIIFNNLKEWEPGKYFLTLRTKDKNGTPVELQKYFTLFESNSGNMPGKEPAWTYMYEKNYEPGRTAELYIGSAGENVKALFEIEQDGRILRNEWIALDNEIKKIDIPIEEEYRGNIIAHVSLIVNNENHTYTKVIYVPWTNKELNISLDTFREKLMPGAEENWKLTVKSSDGKPVAAEFLASMYDASLDAFVPHYWNLSIYPSFYPKLNWVPDNAFGAVQFYNYNYDWNIYISREPFYYPYLNNFGFYFYGFGYGRNLPLSKSEGGVIRGLANEKKDAAMEVAPVVMADEIQRLPGVPEFKSELEQKEQKEQLENVPVRKNLNETAFFYPELKTNENGEVTISFKVPEALTKWKFMGLAVTKDLKSGM